jgi:hypothetical protein
MSGSHNKDIPLRPHTKSTPAIKNVGLHGHQRMASGQHSAIVLPTPPGQSIMHRRPRRPDESRISGISIPNLLATSRTARSHTDVVRYPSRLASPFRMILQSQIILPVFCPASSWDEDDLKLLETVLTPISSPHHSPAPYGPLLTPIVPT